MTNKPIKDPVARAHIERTLAKYRGIVPPRMLEAMRTQLEHLATTHPTARALIEQIQRRPTPIVSEDVPKDGAGDVGKQEKES
jgi:hypothetical protein